jgi:hypothetical protein
MTRSKKQGSSPATVPVILCGAPGQPRHILHVAPHSIPELVAVLSDCNHFAQRPVISTRVPEEDRFQRGKILLLWIEHIGKGKLTKKLWLDILKECPDWPEVRDFGEHQSYEKFRKALGDLASKTRKHIEDGHLPKGWIRVRTS